jgi:tRNA (guanine37-N1)-methyltransferase
MLLKVDPIYRQLRAMNVLQRDPKTRIVMMAPDGEQLTQEKAKELAGYDRLVILSGRYEGFDKRVEDFIDEKISIGPYVLAGGELPALIVTEAVARHIPGVLGHEDAMKDETFSHGEGYQEYPQYTRPEVFVTDAGEEKKVPEILLSGDHAKIEAWKKEQSKK